MTRRNGFTLIELLVSVSIISVLIGLLLPSLSASREKTKRVTCQSNLRQINMAMWQYSISEDGRLPWIETPMTNGGSVPGFGKTGVADADVDPFNPDLWPRSLPNVLMEKYLGGQAKIFVCPSAQLGWPRSDAFRFTYRDAGANQINGTVTPEGSYFRENFGFLDGRKLEPEPVRFSGNAVQDAEIYARSRSTFLRDLVQRPDGNVTGPHNGGVNVISKTLDVEFRDQKTVTEDLAPFGNGVRF